MAYLTICDMVKFFQQIYINSKRIDGYADCYEIFELVEKQKNPKMIKVWCVLLSHCAEI